MAEVKVEERLISGTGLVRYPPTEAAVRYVSVLFDVIRQPSVIDLSFKYSPPRQRYATLVFLRGGYVIDELPLNYARRRFDFVLDSSGQTLLAVKCAHKGALQYYSNLSAAIAPAATVPSNSITDFPNLSMLWDEIQVCCHVDTALQVRVFIETYNLCDEEYSEKSPPPPPAPLPPVPTGTPIGEISPPYPDDDDVTSPYPGDESLPPPDPLEPPTGEDGVFYTITFTYDRIRPSGVIYDTQTVSFTGVRGIIQDYGISDDMTAYGSSAPGGYAIGTAADGLPLYFTNGLGFVGFSTCANLRDISITPPP